MKITIELQEGFQEDTVLIFVDKREIFHEHSVSSDLRLGHAASITAEIEQSPVNIEVEVPSRHISSAKSIEAHNDIYLWIFVDGQNMSFRIANEPFRYF